MNKINEFAQKHPVWLGGLLLTLLSTILNLAWIAFTGMPHMYDLVHVFPVILIYEPIIESLGGSYSPLIFLPLILLMDGLLGMVSGWLIKRITKTYFSYWLVWGLWCMAYWTLVTYQFLPLI